MEATFNTEVYGTTGWAKFSTPMVGGAHTSEVTASNKAFDAYIAEIRKGSAKAPAALLASFNSLAIQLHALGVCVIDGKPSYNG